MCGILCICSEEYNKQDLLENYADYKENINRRGPDYQGLIFIKVYNCNLIFAASVLWLQGEKLTKQPVETEDGIFLYNGDIFNYLDLYIENNLVEGDTITLVKSLKHEAVHKLFSSTQGPYAFVYLDKRLSKLYFGRDRYGRRSLLIGKKSNTFIITSTAKRTLEWEYIELPAIGTFCFNLNTKKFDLYPWNNKNENFNSHLKDISEFLNSSINLMITFKHLEENNFKMPESNELEIFQKCKLYSFTSAVESLLVIDKWFSKVSKLEELLSRAVQKRVSIQQNCNNCTTQKVCVHSSTGVLFSGGVDCAILAVFTNKFVKEEQPIDLLNVAFSKTENYNTPDRLTALNTLEELKQLCPKRKWNFVEINVSETELNLIRKERIADLIFPLKTILDDSLGCALWFASRGENNNYKSTCRVLMVGMGADELFGGYTKHRNSLKREGWLGLFKSLEEDWQNLPYRNLARDDRVVSDHGRQLRTPYLDENVVEFSRSLNCWERTYPTDDFPQGLGEKILLRSLAYKLGLKKASFLKKKALQFGSKIANSKENANDVSPRLLENGKN